MWSLIQCRLYETAFSILFLFWKDSLLKRFVNEYWSSAHFCRILVIFSIVEFLYCSSVLLFIYLTT